MQPNCGASIQLHNLGTPRGLLRGVQYSGRRMTSVLFDNALVNLCIRSIKSFLNYNPQKVLMSKHFSYRYCSGLGLYFVLGYTFFTKGQ